MGRIPAGGGGGGKVPQIVEERITATGTWTKPDGVDWVEITLVGGGGAGTQTSPGLRAGGGGGAGQFVRKIVPVSGPVPIVIGAGGAYVPAATSPGPIAPGGGDTTWGSPSPVVALGGNSLGLQGFGSGLGARSRTSPTSEFSNMGGGGGGASSIGSHFALTPFSSRFSPGEPAGISGQLGYSGGRSYDGLTPISPGTGYGQFSATGQNGGEGIENFAGGGAGGVWPSTKTGFGSAGFGGGRHGVSGAANTGGGGGANGGSGGSGIAIVRYREQ